MRFSGQHWVLNRVGELWWRRGRRPGPLLPAHMHSELRSWRVSSSWDLCLRNRMVKPFLKLTYFTGFSLIGRVSIAIRASRCQVVSMEVVKMRDWAVLATMPLNTLAGYATFVSSSTNRDCRRSSPLGRTLCSKNYDFLKFWCQCPS